MKRASSLRMYFRYSKRLVRMLIGKDLLFPVQARCEKISLGSDGARWSISPSGLSPESVVYSFGVGEDVSFDLQLIRRFGVRVHAFDPTPRAIDWLKTQRLPEEFVFHDYGVAEYEGTATFSPPLNARYVSYSLISRHGDGSPVIEAPVHRLATIMKVLGHEKLDVLKMDIEGAEYRVIRDLLACGIPVDELLVEFHHKWPEVGIGKTKEAVQNLNRAGYKIFDVSPAGDEYSFRRM